MRKILFLSIAMVLMLSPVIIAFGNPYVKDDDLIETIFEGVVTDLDTGDPIPEVKVYAFDEGYDEWRSVYTNEDGYYYFEFRQGGTFYLFAEHPDYNQGEKTETVEMNSQTTVNFELEMIVYDTRIFGIVTDFETGEPIAEAMVNIWELWDEDGEVRWSIASQVITGSDGKYSCEVFQGNYSLDVGAEYYDRYIEESLFLESGEEYEHDVELHPWNQGVKGTITDEEGEPLENIGVSLSSDYFRIGTNTDENGDYELFVPKEGILSFSAQGDGYRPFVTDVEITDDEMEELDVEMVESYLPPTLLRAVYIILILISGI